MVCAGGEVESGSNEDALCSFRWAWTTDRTEKQNWITTL